MRPSGLFCAIDGEGSSGEMIGHRSAIGCQEIQKHKRGGLQLNDLKDREREKKKPGKKDYTKVKDPGTEKVVTRRVRKITRRGEVDGCQQILKDT